MIKKISIIFISVFFTMTSCEDDFLETSPTDAISSVDALATAGNMRLVLNGLHRVLYSSGNVLPGGIGTRGGNHRWIPLGDNIPGGVLHSGRSNNARWQDETLWLSHTQETSSTSSQLWYQRYHIIAGANAIINKIAEGSLVVDAQLSEVLGQAYTYRAYGYLSLVQHYGKGYLIGNPSTDLGVPILFSSDSPFTSAARSTVQEVYNQCMLDVDAAIATFQGATSRATESASDKSQLNIDVAYGLKARIALNSGQWEIAADAARAARQNYPLMGKSDYFSGFNSTLLPEVIWGSNVILTESVDFDAYFYLMSNTFNGSQIRNNPKFMDRRLYAQIPDTDYRRELFLKDAPNSNSSASNGSGGFSKNTNPLYPTREDWDAELLRLQNEYGWTSRHNTHPYMHVKMRQKQPGTTQPDDIILMRSSEMYLIEAEAEAMLNNVAKAQDALRPLGNERDANYDVTIYNDLASLMEQIKFQRKLELWGEGFLYTDKIRWDEGIDHGANGGSGASFTLYQDGFVQAKPSENDDWIFKIPQREIDANPNIGPEDQN